MPTVACVTRTAAVLQTAARVPLSATKSAAYHDDMERRRLESMAWWVVAVVGCHEPADASDDGESSPSSSAGASTEGSSQGDSGSTGSGDGSSGASTADTELPSPYSDGTTGSSDMPSIGADDVTAAIVAGLDAFVTADPQGVLDAYDDLAVFEPGCPEFAQEADMGTLNVLVWQTEGCTTSAGLTVRGSGRIERRLGYVDGDRVIDGAQLSSQGGTFRLETDDGRYFELAGYIDFTRATNPDGSDGALAVTGDVSADPVTAAGSPILSGDVRLQGYLYAYMGTGYRGLGGSGSVTGDVLGNALALSFDQALVVDLPCAAEPLGTFGVRDDVGFWHDVVFDAGTYDDQGGVAWNEGACDGCGAYLAGGVASGDACVDSAALAQLIAWEGMPW